MKNGDSDMKVFISYAREDIETARKLYHDLKHAGITTWMDKEDILIGENWKIAIRQAIKESSYFIALLSSNSLSKKGYVQKELKMALDIFGEMPVSEIFFLPIRLDDCHPLDEQLQDINWGDLFPSYEEGFQKILRVLSQKRQDGNIPDSPQTEEDVPDKKEADQKELLKNQPLKTESSEEKPVTNSQNKRNLTARDAEKSVLVSGDRNVINIIHQYEPDQKKTEQDEVVELNEPVIEDSPSQPPKEAEKPAPLFSDTQRKQKQKFQRSKIIAAVFVVSLLLIAVFKYVNSPKFVKPDLPLRNTPITVSDDEAQSKFKLKKDSNGWWRPLEYIKNDFKDNGDTITDRATGLMWQKSGSSDYMNYEKAKAYIEELNSKKFAGYSDWRLPTVDELKSLLTPETQSNGLYINPIFDKNQSWCWSSDNRASGVAWLVYFLNGLVYWYNVNFSYVRAVRSRQ